MNGNNSMTADAERLPDIKRLKNQWENIDWLTAERYVNRLQTRIAKATQRKKWNQVKRLQYLLTHSFYARALAVRSITGTPVKRRKGVRYTQDRKMRAVLMLNEKKFRKTILCEGRGFGRAPEQKSQLSNLCGHALGVVYAMASRPMVKTTPNLEVAFVSHVLSNEELHNKVFGKNNDTEWVLNEKGVTIKSAYIFEKWIISYCSYINQLKGETGRKPVFPIIRILCYAGRFFVAASTREMAVEAGLHFKQFCIGQGRKSPYFTQYISNLNNWVDIGGWTYRKMREEIIIRPSKKSVKALVASLSNVILRQGKAWSQDRLIQTLNSKIYHWIAHYRGVYSRETTKALTYVEHMLHILLWRWAKRRHPRKGRQWLLNRYWHETVQRNVFSTMKLSLMRVRLPL